MTDADLEIRAEVDHSDPRMGGGGRVGLSPKNNFAPVSSESKGGSDPRDPSPGSATEEGLRWML